MLLLETQEYTIPHIKKLCAPFLEHNSDGSVCLFRDLPDQRRLRPGQLVSYVQTRKGRKAKDSATHIHDAVDDLFNTHFKYRYRSDSVFCWPQKMQKAFAKDSEASSTAIVIPVGQYNILHSRQIKDLYAWIDNDEHHHIMDLDEIEQREHQFTDEHGYIPNEIELLLYTMSESAPVFDRLQYKEYTAIRKLRMNYEAMVGCKGYFLVRESIYSQLFDN